MKRAWPLALTVCVLAPVGAWGQVEGEQVFERYCAHCHAPGGDRPGTLQLGLTRGADKAVLTERDDLTAEYVRYVVRNGLRSMPAFVPSDLDEERLEALTRYLAR